MVRVPVEALPQGFQQKDLRTRTLFRTNSAGTAIERVEYPNDQKVVDRYVPKLKKIMWEAGSGLCEVCHAKTSVYNSTGTGGGHSRRRCSICHNHAMAFGVESAQESHR